MKALAIVVGNHMTDKYESAATVARERDMYKDLFYITVLEAFQDSTHHSPEGEHHHEDANTGVLYDTDPAHFKAWYEQSDASIACSLDELWTFFMTSGAFVSHVVFTGQEHLTYANHQS